MNNRNLLLKIIKFALILGSSFMGKRLLAEDLKICPENLPKLGVTIYSHKDLFSVRKKYQ